MIIYYLRPSIFAEQAAAHGLPMVATKNGGPVDIHRVCMLIKKNKDITLLVCE